MLNKYERAAKALITKKQAMPLHLVFNRNQGAANWDDQHWNIQGLNGVQFGFPLYNIVKGRNIKGAVISIECQYQESQRHILMCYLLEIRNQKGVKERLKALIKAARHVLAKCDLFTLSQKQLNDWEKYKGESWLCDAKPFIKWLQEHLIIPKTLIIPKESYIGVGDGDNRRANNTGKMPDERALWALGAIRNQIIPNPPVKGQFVANLRNELVVSSATLGLASPQRAAKEQIVLPKSTLQSKVLTLEGKKQTIFWVNYPGSKGYQANRKHFFRGAAEATSQVLDYWNEAGEPARILCRFYEKPSLALKDLLGSYKPANIKGYDLTKPINNMFVLGHLLGFYEGEAQTIPVIKNILSDQTKLIKDLTLTDKVNFGTVCKVLFGVNRPVKRKGSTAYHHLCGIHTIDELQSIWVSYLKICIPTFPYRIVGQNRVRISQALFVFTGKQITISHSLYEFGKSYYSLESIEPMGLISKELRTTTKCAKSIFQKFNFADDISLNLYQLRHWANTMMQNSDDISDEVVAMVSGRKDIKHNAVYDGRTGDEKIAIVHCLLRKKQTDDEMKEDVRVIGHKQYKKATGKSATIMSTGVCTQQLLVNPCTYLNDFETHCALCSSSCYFAHDEKALQLLNSDLKAQKARLDKVKEQDYMFFNAEKQRWFKIHHNKTAMLEQLIDLMQREDLEVGTAIKYIGSKGLFRLTDLKKLSIEDVQAVLPDSEAALSQIIESKQHKSKPLSVDENKLGNLLLEYGIKVV